METDFDYFPSHTYRIVVGCGHVYVTVVYCEGQIIRVISYWKSSLHCDLTFFDAVNRQTTFQTNRELEQTIKDLKGMDHPTQGHFCHKYNIYVKGAMKQGRLGAFSCADAIARAVEKEIELFPSESTVSELKTNEVEPGN